MSEVTTDDRETDEALLLLLRRPYIGEGRRSISDSESGLFLFLKECVGRREAAIDLVCNERHDFQIASGSVRILCSGFDVFLNLR